MSILVKKKVLLSVYVDYEVLEWLNKESEKTGRSVSSLVREAINRMMEESK